MKQRCTLLLAQILFCASLLTAQGSVQNRSFFSPTLGADENYQIYLPEGYDPNGTAAYPVVYFLHGAANNYTSYPCVLDTVESLIEAGIIQPMILVKPNGDQGPYLGSMYVNSVVNGNVEDYLIQELIQHVDATFKTKAERQYRCIFGHSMGAAGATQLALKYPEMFRAFAAHSGALDMSQMPLFFNVALAVEHPGGPPYSFVYNVANPYQKLLTSLLFSASSGWSPNPSGTPEPVDFPLDAQGNYIPAVKEKWDAFDPARWVTAAAPDPDLGIWFDCGEQDAFQFYPMNLGFRDSLDKAGANYFFESYQGGHGDKICERMRKSLIYLDSMMMTPLTSSKDEADLFWVKIHPNPASHLLNVQLPDDAGYTAEVTDLSGRRHILDNGQGGLFSLHIQSLPSGIYLLKIRSEKKRCVVKFMKR